MNTNLMIHKALQWGSLTALGTLALAPLLSMPNAAAADPVRYAQTSRQTITLSGVVTQDLAGREFRMRSSDGHEFRVIIDAGHEPRALSRNDLVKVNGYFTSGLFIANSLTITNDRPGSYPQDGSQGTGRVVVSGVVTQDLAGSEFRMRGSDGREFRVIIESGHEPRTLSRNDLVRVNGYFTSGLFIANNLIITSNRPEAYPQGGTPGNGQVVVTGVVTQDLAGREFRMRSSDGREFRVIIDAGREPRALSRNDRVSVRGYFTSGLFIANSLTITNDRPGSYPQDGTQGTGRVVVSGVVTQDLAGSEFRMRGSDGREFRVIIESGYEPRALSGNDRVSVRGYFTSGLFIANNVSIVSNSNVGQPGQTVTLSGVVTSDLAGREFRMRSSDGREFRVIIESGHEPRTLSRNDLVRVNGYFTSGLFIANDLTITNDRSGAYPQDGYRQLTIEGTVANVDSSVKLWVRAYNGVIYEVVTSTPLAPAITVGDTVRVTGWGSAESLRTDQVTLLRNVTR